MDLKKIVKEIILKYPYFRSDIEDVEIILDNSEETAATDGINIFYNSDFLESLNFEEQIGVVAHEILHIIFKHTDRIKDRNHYCWNIACDAVINANLEKDNLKLPQGAVNIPNARTYNVETLYNILIENSTNLNIEIKNHKRWGNSVEKNIEKTKKDDSNNNEPKKSEVGIENTEIDDLNINEVKRFEKNRETIAQNLEELKKELLNKFKNELNEAKENKKGLEIDLNGRVQQKIDWRRILESNIKKKYDWSYENIEIEHGVLNPTLTAVEGQEVEILIDTSGSVSDDLIRSFLLECKNVLKDSVLYVGCFDTEFYGFQKIKNERDLKTFKIEGRGGTNFNVAINAFSKRVSNRIIFTDGYATMPKSDLSALWIVYYYLEPYEINPNNGKVIYVDKNDILKYDNNVRRRFLNDYI